MKFRELCTKEIVQLSNGACLGRADDLELDPATAQVKSLLLLGQPHLFGLLGRDSGHPLDGHRNTGSGRDPGPHGAAGAGSQKAGFLAKNAALAGRLKFFVNFSCIRV